MAATETLHSLVHWLTGHVLWVSSAALFICGVALRKAAAALERRKGGAIVMASESTDKKYREIRVQLMQLSLRAGGLPALPERPIEYEGWFQDVKKRIEMRSERRTVVEYVEMLKRINELHDQWLRLHQTKYELTRVGARAAVEDAKIQLELKQIELETAKLDDEIHRLKKPKVAPSPQASENDRLHSRFRPVRTVAELKRLKDEEMARYSNDSEMRELIETIYDDERQRILEGRR